MLGRTHPPVLRQSGRNTGGSGAKFFPDYLLYVLPRCLWLDYRSTGKNEAKQEVVTLLK